jgi:Mat/Ecp fimbriae major subunit
MNKFLRMASLGATVAALTLTATPAAAFGLVNATSNANAHVKIMKGLVLSSTRNLDLGTVVLAGGTGSWTATVAVDRSNVFDCDGNSGNVVCSGTHQNAQYNVKGTNNAMVTIASGPVTMSNGTDNLTLTPDHDTSVQLPNSGNTGLDFGVGGSITVDNNTPDGDYTGTFAVTAEYQ